MRDKKGRFIKGHKVSVGLRKKLSERNKLLGIKPPSRKGIPSSQLQKKRASETHKGRKDTEETRLKRIASVRRRDRCHFWKGGITPINLSIRMSSEYKLWRKAVFERDNYTCIWCGQKGGKLNADHIKRFSDFPELRFAIDNGITLSEKAHIEFHKIYGKKNNTREQLEDFLKLKLLFK